MPSREEQEALDAALDAALDDLDDDDYDDKKAPSTRTTSEPPSSPMQRPIMGPARPPPAKQQPPQDPDKLFMKMMEDMLLTEQEGVEDPDQMMSMLMERMKTELENAGRELEQEEGEDVDTDSKNTPQQAQPNKSEKTKKDLDDTISKLVSEMAKEQDGEAMPNEAELLEMLMKGLDPSQAAAAGQVPPNFDADAMIDGMMEQLMSKELMYEPMKQVAEKFPGWLQEKKNALTEQEYKDRSKQCECFQKLVQVYESNPNDSMKLMMLMQEVQEFGQPPPEIIKEIAPGLELDENGLPKLDGSKLFDDEEGNGECLVM